MDSPQEGYIRLIQNRDYKTNDYATFVPKSMVSKFCDIDDVMIGRYGPPLFVLHRGLAGAYNVAIMKAVPMGINREFMWFYLQNISLLNYIESFSARTAGQSGVNPTILKKYPIFIPPLAEQIAIAEYLDKKCSIIDTNIAKRELINAKLTEYKKSLIYEVVTGKKEI